MVTIDPCTLHATPVVRPFRPNLPRTIATRSSPLPSTPAAVPIAPHTIHLSSSFPSPIPSSTRSFVALHYKDLHDPRHFSRVWPCDGASKHGSRTESSNSETLPWRTFFLYIIATTKLQQKNRRAEDFTCCRNSPQTEKTVIIFYWFIFKIRLILIKYCVYIVFIKLLSLQKIVSFLPEISILNRLQANFASTVPQVCPEWLFAQGVPQLYLNGVQILFSFPKLCFKLFCLYCAPSVSQVCPQLLFPRLCSK